MPRLISVGFFFFKPLHFKKKKKRQQQKALFSFNFIFLNQTFVRFILDFFVIIFLFFFLLSFPSFVFFPPSPLPSFPLPLLNFPPLVEPSAPPQDVKCVSTRSTAILVSWRPPPAESQNGVLAGYSVHYRALDSEDTELKEVNDIPPTTSQILLESLEKWTEYRVTVVAHTEVGPGPESSPVIVRTDEDGN